VYGFPVERVSGSLGKNACVCERETERERERNVWGGVGREIFAFSTPSLSSGWPELSENELFKIIYLLVPIPFLPILPKVRLRVSMQLLIWGL